MKNKSAIFTAYLEAFSSGDIDTAREYIADDFTFQGPVLQAEGKDVFFEGAISLLPVVNGYKMLRQFEDGEDVCSIYEFNIKTPIKAGSVLMTEWSQIRDGKIASSKLVFDTAAMTALMPN